MLTAFRTVHVFPAVHIFFAGLELARAHPQIFRKRTATICGGCTPLLDQRLLLVSRCPGGSVADLNNTAGGYSSAPPTTQGPGVSLPMAALRVLLLNERGCPGTSRWLESTKPLSLASVQMCEQCRETIPVHVRVGDETPRSVWEPREPCSSPARRGENPPAESSKSLLKATPVTRVPPATIVKIASDMPDPAKLLFALARTGEFRWLREVSFGEISGLCVSGISWPKSVRTLAFRCSFSHPLSAVAWPAALERLALEGLFNQSVVGISWPAGLKSVTLGKRFNQPIDEVGWPAGIAELSFGHSFNQTVNNLGATAAGLRELTLGWEFDQSLDEVALPKGLEVLVIVGVYNRPLDRVQLPAGLKALTLGGHFDKPLTTTLLPRRLEFLSLGWAFNHPLVGVDWPGELKRVTLGYRFNQPANCVTFPPRLESLELGVFSRQSLKGLAWPPSLNRLAVGRAFDLTGVSLPECARVCRPGRK